VLPSGLDPDYVTGGVDLGPVRRPLPVRKALDDVLVAYEMNGEPLSPDHGFPARLVVPDWIGIASIK
jgi:DMSO/TMAO reductase YedYZ molybdopterin-dependent catalytic subunit